jgi:hypothetical protein
MYKATCGYSPAAWNGMATASRNSCANKLCFDTTAPGFTPKLNPVLLFVSELMLSSKSKLNAVWVLNFALH